MAKQTISRTMLKFLGGTALALAAALTLASCASPLYPAPSGDQLNNLQQMTANGFDRLEANDRQMKTDLDNLNAAADSNNEKMLSLIDDLNRQMKAMQADFADVKARMNERPAAPPSGNGMGMGTGPGVGSPATPATYPTFAAAINGGKTLFDQGQYGPAGDAFKAAQAMAANDNERLQALYWQGETSFAQRDYAAAERFYTDAIQINSQSLEAWMSFERLGDIDQINGNNQAAMEKYKTILQQYPRYPGADRVKGKIATLQGGAPAPGGPMGRPMGMMEAPAAPAMAPAQPAAAPVANVTTQAPGPGL